MGVYMKELTFEEKANEYIEKLKELKRVLCKEDDAKFSSGTSMFNWYYFESAKLKKYAKEKDVPRDVMDKLIMIANIDNLLYNIKLDKKKAAFKQKVEEYIEKIRELGRNVCKKDEAKFSTKEDMHYWYYNQCSRLIEEFESEKTLSAYRTYEIMLFIKIDDELQKLKKEGKVLLSYEEKVKEYITEVKRLGRNLKSRDDIKFSDGTDMYVWYANQGSIIRLKDLYSKPTKKRMGKIMMYAKIDYELYNLSKK